MALDLRKEFGTNKQVEQEGAWAPIGDGAELKIARFGNPRHTEITTQLMRPYRAAVRAGVLPDKTLNDVTIKAIAKSILLDWRGIQVDGKDVAYSEEAAIELLTQFPDFRDQVTRLAREITLFQDQDQEEQQGN